MDLEMSLSAKALNFGSRGCIDLPSKIQPKSVIEVTKLTYSNSFSYSKSRTMYLNILYAIQSFWLLDL